MEEEEKEGIKNPQSIIPIQDPLNENMLDPAILSTDALKMDPDNMVLVEQEDESSKKSIIKQAADNKIDDIKVPEFNLDAEEEEKQLNMDSQLLDDKYIRNGLDTVIEEDSRINSTILP